MTREHAYKLREMIVKASISLSDEDALEAIELYPAWKTGTAYAVDERIRYDNTLYRCVQAHTSQADWTPDIAVSLYAAVPEPGEIPVWKQPTGAQNAYQTGDKVWYPEKDTTVYISDVDNNVWQPDVYGWHVLS